MNVKNEKSKSKRKHVSTTAIRNFGQNNKIIHRPNDINNSIVIGSALISSVILQIGVTRRFGSCWVPLWPCTHIRMKNKQINATVLAIETMFFSNKTQQFRPHSCDISIELAFFYIQNLFLIFCRFWVVSLSF